MMIITKLEAQPLLFSAIHSKQEKSYIFNQRALTIDPPPKEAREQRQWEGDFI